MPGLNIGCARVSTDQKDLTAQRDGLQALGVAAERIYVDHGLTGTNRERPGLHQALAACRADARVTPAGSSMAIEPAARVGWLRSVPASRTTDEPPSSETIGDVVEALRLLEVGVGVANYKQRERLGCPT